MDKSCHSSGDSTITTNTSSSTSSSNKDHYLKHLNKISHKISKPIIRRPTIDHPNHQYHRPPPPQPQPQPQPQLQQQQQQQQQHQQQQQQQQQHQQQQQQQHQPPVYNINKNDFRDVVQKLTGSPAHDRFSTPPPIQPPKPQSSRLQRIRPPPLDHVSNRPPLVQASNRPPPMLNSSVSPPPACALNPNNPINSVGSSAVPGYTFGNNGRQVSPLSPLPPFPAVHAAAESPISAYMRYLQTADSDPKRLAGFSPLAPLVSPRWINSVPPPQHTGIPPPPPPTMTSNMSQYGMPSSPLPFGCLPSPRSPYPLLSPSLLFSPSAGQLGFQQFPLSPRLPVPSPRWRDI